MNILLKTRFPTNNKSILPTSLGNTISAFEYYPKERYGIDSVYLWTRLIPILQKENFLPFIQREKTTLDFLLNLVVVSLIISFFEIILFGLYKPDFNYLLICSALLIAAYIFYNAAVFVAKDWGMWVCTAFDIYRNDLRKLLHLRPIKNDNLSEEKQMWEEISEFIIYGTSSKFRGFVYDQENYFNDEENSINNLIIGGQN